MRVLFMLSIDYLNINGIHVCHPLAPLGVPDIINTKPSVPPRGGSTLGYYYAALTGSKFRYADAPQTTLQIPIYRANFRTHV